MTDTARELTEIDAINARVTGVFNATMKKAKRGEINEAEVLKILESDVLMPWRDARRRLARIQGLPDENMRLLQQLDRSMDLYEQTWVLLCKSIRNPDDPELVRQAEAKMAEANKAWTDLNQQMKKK